MSAERQLDANSPEHHTTKIREMLTGAIDHVRSDVGKVSDPKAQALFKTTAEVLTGLRKAYLDFEERSETAWKKAS